MSVIASVVAAACHSNFQKNPTKRYHSESILEKDAYELCK
jgi:hypothetical protein